MEKNNKMVLNHMMLYAKGWYKHTKNLWEGYRRAIYCEGHYTPYDMHDVAYYMFKYLIEHKDVLLNNRPDADIYIYTGIRDRMMDIHYLRKNGDEESQNYKFENVYDMATILFCHEIFNFTDKSLFSDVVFPSKRVMPLSVSWDETHKDAFEKAFNMFGKHKSYDTNDIAAKRMYKLLRRPRYSVSRAIADKELVYEGPKTKYKIENETHYHFTNQK